MTEKLIVFVYQTKKIIGQTDQNQGKCTPSQANCPGHHKKYESPTEAYVLYVSKYLPKLKSYATNFSSKHNLL